MRELGTVGTGGDSGLSSMPPGWLLAGTPRERVRTSTPSKPVPGPARRCSRVPVLKAPLPGRAWVGVFAVHRGGPELIQNHLVVAVRSCISLYIRRLSSTPSLPSEPFDRQGTWREPRFLMTGGNPVDSDVDDLHMMFVFGAPSGGWNERSISSKEGKQHVLCPSDPSGREASSR